MKETNKEEERCNHCGSWLPTSKIRTIRAEELPPFFWIKCESYAPMLVTAINYDILYTSVMSRNNIDGFNGGWIKIDRLRKDGWQYSEHHSKGAWHEFEAKQ